MRLTLRTLLAYLDDTLDPTQAKVIGQKIAESTTAQELIARIKEVVRRRRLTTPADTMPGDKSDANTIAEYIDSVLPPEKLAEVEALCLESDVHLAEMAACHQILTVILSKPALVPPLARQRMYGLIHGREAIPYRKASKVVSVDGTAREGPSHSNEADEALLLGLPLYQSGGPWYYRLLPVGIIGVLLIALGAAIWQALPSTPRGRRPAHETQVARAEDPTAAGTQTKAPPEKAAEKPEPVPATAKAAEPRPDTTTAPSSIKGGADVASVRPTPTTVSPSTSKPPDTTPDAAAKEKSPPPDSQPKVEPKPVEIPPTMEPREAIGRYVVPGANPSVLLARARDNEPWRRISRNAPINTLDSLVSLPGYRSEIRLTKGVHVLLWGDVPDASSPVVMLESRAVLHASQDFDCDLELQRGRVAISNHRPQGPARIRLRFKGQSWEATLLDTGTEIAVELVGYPDVGFNRNPSKEEEPIAGVGLYVLQGQANLKVGYNTHYLREPPGPTLFIWNNISGAAPAPKTLTVNLMPPWTRRAAGLGKDVQAMRQAEDRLANRMSNNAPVDVVLQEMMQEGDITGRVLAVYSAGGVDDLPDLVDAMGNERASQERIAAIGALRQWLGHSGKSDAELYQTVATKYRPAQAEIIMELLHPYSDRQKRQPETYEALIAFLKHDQLAIRELAYSHLSALVPDGRKIGYDPAGTADQRAAAYDQWKKLIPSGKLPPAPGSTPNRGGRTR